MISRKSSVRVAISVLTAHAYLLGSCSEGQTVHNWNNAAGGNYNFSFNWTPGNVPDGTSESARFNLASTYDVFLFGDRTVSDLLVNDGNVRLTRPATATSGVTYTVDDDAFVTGATFALEKTFSTHSIILDVSDRLEVHDTAFFNVSDGAAIIVNGQLRVGADSSGDGELSLTGTGTTLSTSAADTAVIGGSGSTGTLNLKNSATSTIGGDLHLAQSNATGSAAELNLSTNATLDVAGDLNMVSGGSNNQDGVFNVNSTALFTLDGNTNIGAGTGTTQTTAVAVGGTFTQNGTSTFNLGTSTGAGNSSSFVVDTGGVASTGTGNISIGDTGALNIQNNGTFNANGPLTMSAESSLTLSGSNSRLNANAGLDNSAGGALNFSTGRMTVTNGAFVPNAGGAGASYSLNGAVPNLKLSTGATATFGGTLSVADSAGSQVIFAIEDGAAVLSGDAILANQDNSAAIATLTGADSTWNVTNQLIVGNSGSGNLAVRDGAMLQSNSGIIGNNVLNFSPQLPTVVDVRNPGSTWNVTDSLIVGNAERGKLTIADGGRVSSTTGFVAFSAAVLSSSVDITGQDSEWEISADLYIGGNTTSAGGTGALAVSEQGKLRVGGALKIWQAGSLVIDNGTVIVDGPLDFAESSIDFTSGRLELNHPSQSLIVYPTELRLGTKNLLNTTTLDATRELAVGGELLVTPVATLTIDGGNVEAGSTNLLGGSHLRLQSATFASGPLRAASGSQIHVTGAGVDLGDASAVDGVFIEGTFSLNGNDVVLLDANDAVFDSGALVNLGDSDGTLTAANGLTLDFGGNITGFGTLETPNDSGKPLINNGHIRGNSLADAVFLTGYVKGVGTCDNCVITGTDAPGFSPASVNRGSVSYNGTLEIEIGGSSTSDFDQLHHVFGAGIADLGGQLDVDLINGFLPSAGEFFEIITAAQVQGLFAVQNLPALAGGLRWQVDYQPTSVVLRVALGGDFDFDNDVDGRDFLVWQRDSGVGSLADWQTNYGMVVPLSATSAAIPEPSTWVLLSLAVFGTHLTSHKRIVERVMTTR
ncbi:beta strand repeat-containing protein [Adhaeretor mobilis]|uniref:Autotransporter-associated beta strand repeat protein n=1 Tax=Adhaeretor mobilis TaxID=1930276 RepID=A0A517MV39_9BACT|nr:hypothetical protein [Adhaeretor mobilis]QDS98754.1 hypothetical protein HG15A2_20380 [Adhaeretor mobilis]